jgi:hypothetical protein
MALGPRDLKNLTLPTGWDAAELVKFQLQDGTTYGQVAAAFNTALGALNAELRGDPLWSSLVSYSAEPGVNYRVGTANGFERFTEYGRADARRAETEGHMLPLVPYDRMLGWTWAYLKEARIFDIEADIADAIKDARDRFRVSILSRLLKRGDDTGTANGLGSSGISPGFATAAASTGVDFVPPAYGGTAFTVNHEHYVAIAGGVFTNDVFADVKDELREHGHEPPYEFVVGTADEAVVTGLSAFVPTANQLISYGTTTTLSTLSNAEQTNGSYYIGTIHDIAVRVVRGVPRYYGFGWKTYGPNSQRNPLRVRLEKNATAMQVMAMTDPRAGTGLTPLQNLMLYMEFGVGVADRTNGTARYVNNATWADGVPT